MLQRVIKHLQGRFRRCAKCGSEPRHVTTRGRPSSEPVAFAPIGARHSLECRCGERTAPHPLLIAAEAEWNDNHAQGIRRASRKVAA